MKKMMKKLIAMAAALVMIVTLLPAVGVKAASTIDYSMEGKGVLNIYKTDQNKNPLAGAEFTIYKIASLDQNGWTLVEANKGTLKSAEELFNLTKDEQRVKAEQLATVVTQKVETQVTATGTGLASFDQLGLGIYLVVETKAPTVTVDGDKQVTYMASVPFLVSIPSADNADDSNDLGNDGNVNASATEWKYTVNARPKNTEASIDKGIKTTDGTVENIEAGVGDQVDYIITSVAPSYSAEYFKDGGAKEDPVFKISDKLSIGLTLVNPISDEGKNTGIVVKCNNTTLTEGTDYEVITTNVDKTFEIKFTNDFLKNKAYYGKQITVEYSAIVNEKAIVGTDGNTNEAILDFNNAPGSDAQAEPGTTPKVYTYGFKFTKTDSKGQAIITQDAKFKLYKLVDGRYEPVEGLLGMTKEKVEDEKTSVMTSDENGIVSFNGLEEGQYQLEEIQAPNGYTLLTDRIDITISGENGLAVDPDREGDKYTVEGGYVVTNIINNKGFTLPETGGMGTYLFTIGGIVIMAGAAFALIAMKKRA